MKSLKNLNFEKIRNVGIRVDLNVPINKNFKIISKKVVSDNNKFFLFHILEDQKKILMRNILSQN